MSNCFFTTQKSSGNTTIPITIDEPRVALQLSIVGSPNNSKCGSKKNVKDEERLHSPQYSLIKNTYIMSTFVSFRIAFQIKATFGQFQRNHAFNRATDGSVLLGKKENLGNDSNVGVFRAGTRSDRNRDSSKTMQSFSI